MSENVVTPMDVDDPKKDNQKSQLPWVEKYRPQRLEDLVAHEQIINIITNLIDSDNLPHLLLYGPPGTGKTSTIVAAAKRMYGPKAYGSMTLELNASDARGIDVVRNEIKEFAGTKQLFNTGVKLIILDEADAMTSDAQFALRRVIEKYTKNARFCLICNYVSKIIPALQSRCTRFRFAPLSQQQIQGRLEEVAKLENCHLTSDGLRAILHLSDGDMRRVLNLLQATAMSASATASVSVAAAPATSASASPSLSSQSEAKTMDSSTSPTATMVEINETNVYMTSGSPMPQDIDQILNLLMNEKFHVAYEGITNLCQSKGYALVDILKDLSVKVSHLELIVDGNGSSSSSSDNKNKNYKPLCMLLEGMADVEYRLASGTDEKIQTASLVGIFIQMRELISIRTTN